MVAFNVAEPGDGHLHRGSGCLLTDAVLVVEFGGDGLRVGLDAPPDDVPGRTSDAGFAADVAALTGRGWTRRGDDGAWSVELSAVGLDKADITGLTPS